MAKLFWGLVVLIAIVVAAIAYALVAEAEEMGFSNICDCSELWSSDNEDPFAWDNNRANYYIWHPIKGFTSKTPILTPNGWVPISQIRPGDRVISMDVFLPRWTQSNETFGRLCQTRVKSVNIILRQKIDIKTIQAGNAKITTTATQPVYTSPKKKYLRLEDISIIPSLVTTKGIDLPRGVRVIAEEKIKEIVLYTITLSPYPDYGFGNYFVGGGNGVLVHQ